MKTLNTTFVTRFLMLLFFGISLTGIFSCNNDDDNDSEPTTFELLTSGRWYIQASSILATTACDRQKYFDFSDNNTLTVLMTEISDDGCVDLPLQHLTFELTSTNNIILSDGEGSVTLQIISISQNSLVVRQTLAEGPHDLTFDKTAG